MSPETTGQRTDTDPATQGNDAATAAAAAAAATTGATTGATAEQIAEAQKLVKETESKYQALLAQAEADKLTLEGRYKGLQTSLNIEQESHKTTKQALQDAAQKAADAAKQLETLTGLKTNWEAEQEKAKTQISSLERANKRARLIMDKYPELAPFEIDGVLPDGPDDKLEEIFTKFSERIAAMSKKAREEFASGASRRPTGTDPILAEDLELQAAIKRRNDAALKGDQKAYDEAFNEVDKLQKRKQQS